MIQQQLAAMQAYSQAGYWDKFLNRGNVGTKNYEAMQQLPLLEKLASTRSQERQLQAGHLKEIKQTLKDFAGLQTDQQGPQRPLHQKLLMTQAQLAGLSLSPEDIADALRSSDIASMYGDILGEDYTPQERQAVFQQLSSVPPEQREKILGARRAEKDQRLLSQIQTVAPQVIAQMGGTAAKPLDMQTFLTSPQVQAEFKKNPALERVFNAYVNDDKNAKAVAAWGLQPGEVPLAGMKATQELPKMSAEQADFLGAMYSGPDGRPITAHPKLVTSAMMTEAKKAEMAYGVKKAAETGLTTAQFMLTMPAPAEERDKHIDVQALIDTGDLVKPPQGISVGALRTGNYRHAGEVQQKAVTAMKPSRTAFSDMNVIADRLITAETWQEAVVQGARLHAGAFTGADAEAAAYRTAQPAVTSFLARLVESGVMTDQDIARWQASATASFFDTKKSMAIRRAVMTDILNVSEQALIGQVAGVPRKQATELRSLFNRLDQATTETLRNTRAGLPPGARLFKGPKGEAAVLQRGVPDPEGWTEIK